MTSIKTTSCFATFSAGRSPDKDQTMRPISIKWHNDDKIAVSFFVAFEAFEKFSQYRRGGDKPDHASLAYGEYGGRPRIWRGIEEPKPPSGKRTPHTHSP